MKKTILSIIFLIFVLNASFALADSLYEQLQQSSQPNKLVFQPVEREIIKETTIIQKEGSNLLSILVPAVIVLAVIIFGAMELMRLRHEKMLEEERHKLDQLVLRNYIYNLTKKGYSKERIYNGLVREGWQTDKIESAFSGLRKR